MLSRSARERRPKGHEHQHPAAPRGSGGEDTEPRQVATKLRLDYYEQIETELSSTSKERNLTLGQVNCEPGEWAVSVQARELADFVVAGQDLPRASDIVSRGVRHSQLQIVASFSMGMQEDNEYVVDIGSSFVWSFFGMTPKFRVRLPAGALIEQGPPRKVPDPTGAPTPYVDTLIYAAINRAEVWNSRALYQQTFTRGIPPDGVLSIPVPQGTQFVEIYQRGSDATVIPAYDFFSLGGTEITELGVEVGQRRTGRHRVPGNSALIFNRAVPTGSLVTAVFELEL